MNKTLFRISMILSVLLLFSEMANAWIISKRLTWTEGDARSPVIAIDSNNIIHVVWSENTPYYRHELYYKKSSDNGLTWTSAKRLTWLASSDEIDITIDSQDIIHIVWTGYNSSHFEIMYKNSPDHGNEWTTLKRLTWITQHSHNPSVITDSKGNIHVVWTEYLPDGKEIIYKNSIDRGISWSKPVRLTWHGDGNDFPSITVDKNDNIHVVWSDHRESVNGIAKIFYKMSSDGGKNWSKVRQLTWNWGHCEFPDIIVNPENIIFLIYKSQDAIYFKKSTDEGLTWTSSKRITWTNGDIHGPRIAVDNKKNIHIVFWTYYFNYFRIRYKMGLSNGDTWIGAERLTWNSTYILSIFPSIGVDPVNNVHIVWVDERAGNPEIYYSRKE